MLLRRPNERVWPRRQRARRALPLLFYTLEILYERDVAPHTVGS
jgi:hypothetical protein